MDTDNSGDISEDEWLYFWEAVKKSGYSDEDIIDELDGLIKGETWVGFDIKK